MKQSIVRRSLSEVVASKLAAAILDGVFASGSQLPTERDLVKQYGISRTTLREALKTLEENQLIEARRNVGWFVCEVNEENVAKSRELASAEREAPPPQARLASSDTPTGPRRLGVAAEKPLRIPNLKTDRQGTFNLISWWEREKVAAAKVRVVGAGALGNEVIKNLALMGVGHLFIMDFDTIEMANLSRSVLSARATLAEERLRWPRRAPRKLNPGRSRPLPAWRRKLPVGAGGDPPDGRGGGLPG